MAFGPRSSVVAHGFASVISDASGNLLAAPAEALVNPVNCVGVMGKGLALQFRQHFPEMFVAYAKACASGEICVGRLHVFDRGVERTVARWIINFPTKRHWREPSRMADIDAGLLALVATATELRIRSLAVPALGCGLGGLSWEAVRPRIQNAFEPMAELNVLLYGPPRKS